VRSTERSARFGASYHRPRVIVPDAEPVDPGDEEAGAPVKRGTLVKGSSLRRVVSRRRLIYTSFAETWEALRLRTSVMRGETAKPKPTSA
jgi:hypothetical protein